MTHEKHAIEQPTKIDQMDDEPKIGLIDFSRPSDYRLKAIEAKNSGFNSKGDDSHLSCTSKLSTIGTSSGGSGSSTAKSGNTPYEGLFQISDFYQIYLKICAERFKFKSNLLEVTRTVTICLALNLILIFLESTVISNTEKWNQLYAKAEQEAVKERGLLQSVPVKKASTIEILQNNLDKFQHTIQW